MTNYLKLFWQRLSNPDTQGKAEVERLDVLQRTAANRRSEYAAEKERNAPLSSSRKRMEEAEAAHITALQKWENKQSRQHSR